MPKTPAHGHAVQIRGKPGPLRASTRFLIVSNRVATSGSLGGAATPLPLLLETDLAGVGTAFVSELVAAGPVSVPDCVGEGAALVPEPAGEGTAFAPGAVLVSPARLSALLLPTTLPCPASLSPVPADNPW